MSHTAALPAHGVPHSFEADRLFDFARDVIESGSGTREQRLLLHGHTAVAFGLHDRDRECRDLLERALRVASASAERAHVHYLLGHQYHQRRGEWRAAVIALEQTTQLIQAASMVRAFACVNLASAYLELNELDRAQAAANAALSTNIRDVEPHARARLALVLAKRGDLERALQEGRRARERFRRIRSDSGVLSTDELLARIHLENGGAEEALPLLARARQIRFERLDLSQLGRRFHDEATALMEVDRHREAEGAYMQALRYHTGATRDAACAHTLRRLGAVLGNIGQVEDAIAMMHEAAALAARARHPVEEFSSLTDLLELLKRHHSRLDAVPYVLSRCHTVIDSAAPDVSPDRLVALARTTMELNHMGAAMPHGGTIPHPPDFPDPAAASRAREICSRHAVPELDTLLSERIGSHIRVRRAPCVDELKGFLMGWTGSWFGNADYREEFDLPPETSKYQLRLLRDSGIIRQVGQRKATRYYLGFHLTANGFEAET